jgi:hypothetical protein
MGCAFDRFLKSQVYSKAERDLVSLACEVIEANPGEISLTRDARLSEGQITLRMLRSKEPQW